MNESSLILMQITHLMACSLWALRTSGFMFLLAMMSLREAPTIARWNFCVLLVRFLACSSSWPFLNLRLEFESSLNSVTVIQLHLATTINKC